MGGIESNYNCPPERAKIEGYLSAETIEQRVKRLINCLRSGDVKKRDNAYKELVSIGKPAINEVANIIYSEIKNNRINDNAVEVVVKALFILGEIDYNSNKTNPRINDAVKAALPCKNGYVKKVANQVWAGLHKE